MSTVEQIAELKSNRARMFPVVWGHRALVEETLMYTAKDVIGCLIEAAMDLNEAVESLCLQDGVEPWEMDEAAQQAFEYYAHNFTEGCLEWLINHIDLADDQVVEDERIPRGVVVTTGDGKGNIERRVGTGPSEEEAEEDEEAETQRGLRSQMERKKPCRGCWSHYREDEDGHIVCDCTE